MTKRKEGSIRMVRGELENLGLHKNHPFYMAWVNMKTRCDNPNSTQYQWYGGRGIGYIDTWKAFGNFYSDLFPEWGPGLVLDRIDNEAPYSENNCRWITQSQSAQNRRSNVVTIEEVAVIRRLYETDKYTQTHIAERFGVSQTVIQAIVSYKTWS